MKYSAALAGAFVLGTAVLLIQPAPTGANTADKRLQLSSREPERNGWVKVHLEGSPSDIGFQHGYLLAKEIEDLKWVTELELTHDSKKPYSFYRTAAETILWPKIEEEYRQELQGIVEGANARGVRLDLMDVVVMNAMIELGYYNAWLDKQGGAPTKSGAPDRCSAFVATGSYTRDGRIVIAHSNWSGYLEGQRWNVIFDIKPAKGHRILMDGLPGWIHSGDDFGINSAGIAITETTITQFHGFDPNGVPEFMRARKAMQYASSIDDFVRIMKDRNNGGYANNWLIADTNTNEIADLELGLKNVNVRRTKDGYFVGTNFPVNENLAREETEFDVSDNSSSANARRIRATELIESAKGKIDTVFAKKYLSDHQDSFAKKQDPNERTLCGHVDLSPRGLKSWQPPYGIAGTVQAKTADHTLATKLSLQAASGHPCGLAFSASKHLAAHPEFAWQKELLRDLPSKPWTEFSARR